MNNKLSKHFIQELLLYTDIVDIIDSKIKLKRIGKYFRTNCPFHNDKIPSFTVNKEKQFFYCFGCNIHGNVIDFLINYEKISFIDAIKVLANQKNIEIPYYKNKKNHFIYKNTTNNLYSFLEKISFFYNKILKNNKYSYVVQYLKNRGIIQSTLDKFRIGFAPNSNNNLVTYFNNCNENNKLLYSSGMRIFRDDGKSHDFFYERIIFPIRDIYGRVIAFGGRSLLDKNPKYLNSKETNIFKKRLQLYGLYETLLENKNISRLLVVEGYIDVIMLFQFNINYVVSSLGTSTTSQQIKILYGITNKIILCYDGDEAGKKAAWKTMKNSLKYLYDEKQLFFMFLPKNEDPDTLIRKIGKISFEKLIDKSISLANFLFKTLIKKVNIYNTYNKVKFSNLILPLINEIPGNILRICLRQKLGNKIGIFDNSILEKLLSINKKNIYKPIFIKKTNMRILISLLLQNPELAHLVSYTIDDFSEKIPGILIFMKLVEICKNTPKLTTSQLLEYYRGDNIYSKIKLLACWDNMIIDEAIQKTFIDILNKFAKYKLILRQNLLISLDRKKHLNSLERKELWSINKFLAKNK